MISEKESGMMGSKIRCNALYLRINRKLCKEKFIRRDSYLELLMEAKSWADMLNKAEYVQEIYTYDRKMLDNYAATVQEVAQLKESLEEQKSELEASEYELEQEKDSLQVSLDEQKELAADYEVQLAKAKQEAAPTRRR